MSNHGQIERKSRLPKRIASWFRQTSAWGSPNQRLASIVGSLVMLVSWSLMYIAYWDVLPALFPGLPWLGEVVSWAIAAALGISTDIVTKKLLDRFRPRGKVWPERGNQGQ
jgi:hypothetical protein